MYLQGERCASAYTIADRDIDYLQVGMGKLAVELCHDL